jgi:hypothetical protein
MHSCVSRREHRCECEVLFLESRRGHPREFEFFCEMTFFRIPVLIRGTASYALCKITPDPLHLHLREEAYEENAGRALHSCIAAPLSTSPHPNQFHFCWKSCTQLKHRELKTRKTRYAVATQLAPRVAATHQSAAGPTPPNCSLPRPANAGVESLRATETNGMRFVLFGTKDGTISPYSAAMPSLGAGSKPGQLSRR